MNRTWNIPGRVLFLAALFGSNLVLFGLLRLCFFLYFRQDHPILSSEILRSFSLGIRFDARLAAIVCLPVLLLSWIRRIDVAKPGRGRTLWLGYAVLVDAALLFLYYVDFGTYSYIRTRLSTSLLIFLDDPWISARMVASTYPVVTLLLLTLTLAFLLYVILKKSAAAAFAAPPPPSGRKGRALWYSFMVLVLIVSLLGKLGRRPLAWPDAYFSRDMFINQLSLNPVIFLFTTAGKHKKNYDEQLAKQYYPLIAGRLGLQVKNESELSFRRDVAPRTQPASPPNVVIVLLESFAAYKVGALGNPLPSTPCFDGLAAKGMLFTDFYVPVQNTPRSLFSALFGIPDVNLSQSSFSPDLVSQRTILNSFPGYRKFYFTGGDQNYGNIGGILASNIDDLRILGQNAFRASGGGTWGISDVSLAREVNEVLRTRGGKPFFAVVLTSGHHRPYTYPKQESGFEPLTFDGDVLKKNGFISNDAFNSLRYLDRSICSLIESADTGRDFRNTIFVFLGDHGLNDGLLEMDARLGELSLSAFHVPLLVYAPGMPSLAGKRVTRTVSELDLLPTLASLLGHRYVNDALGRDVLDPAYQGPGSAFTFSAWGNRHRVGLVEGKFYVAAEMDGTYSLYQIEGRSLNDVTAKFPDRAKRMAQVARGYYEVSRYLMYHNRPEGSKPGTAASGR